jgi:hypothetical protein
MAVIEVGRTRTFLIEAPYSRQKYMCNDLIEMLKVLYSKTKFNGGYYPEVKELEQGKLKRIPKKELKRLATYHKKKLSQAGYSRIMKM